MSKLIIPGAQDLSGELGLIKGATDYNAPVQATKILIIPIQQVHEYQMKVNQNANYFKEAGIRFVKVLTNEDFGRFLRAKVEREGYSSMSEIEVIKSLGLKVNQDLITY